MSGILEFESSRHSVYIFLVKDNSLPFLFSFSGHLRVVFDFGFERQELIFPNKHFGLGQYHDVRISRKNSGATLLMQVDNNHHTASSEVSAPLKDQFLINCFFH